MARKRIQWPFKGRVDNNARGDQPELTTSDAKNVRNYAAGTERMQGGQRPGLSKLEDSATSTDVDQVHPTSPVRSVSSLAYDRPAFSYSQTSGDITADWEHPNDGDTGTLDVVVDESGNSYFLTSDGVVEKRNSQGVLIWSEPFPVFEEPLLTKIAVDAEGAVYGVYSSNTNIGRLVRIEPNDDDDGADVRYAIETKRGTYQDLFIRGGTLFVSRNDDQEKSAYIDAYQGLDSDEPFEASEYPVTYPVRQITYSKGGLVYASAPASDRVDRELYDGIGPTVIDWHPFDLNNYHERLHMWIDARAHTTDAPGADVQAPDRRDLYLAQATQTTAINDDTTRIYEHRPHSGTHKPRWNPNGLGPYPTYDFDTLRGAPYLNYPDFAAEGDGWAPSKVGFGDWYRDKVSTSDKLNRSISLYPHTLTQTWATTMLVRAKSDEPMVLWQWHIRPKSGVGQYGNYVAVVLNAHGSGTGTPGDTYTPLYFTSSPFGFSILDSPGDEDLDQQSTGAQRLVKQPGAVSLYCPRQYVDRQNTDSGTVTVYTDIEEERRVITDGATWYAPEVHGAGHGGSANVDRMFLITIAVVQDGSDTRLYLRVNGDSDITGIAANYVDFHADRFDPEMRRDMIGNKWASFSIDNNVVFDEDIGGPQFLGGESKVARKTTNHLRGSTGFDGHLCEALTYFGDSSSDASPHDAAYGVRGGGGFFDDVEKVEAYMAHKWGVASTVLKSGTGSNIDGNQYRAAPPSGSGDNLVGITTGQTIAESLRSTLGITAKVQITDGTHVWAVSGPGMGYGVEAAAEDGLVYTNGPRDSGWDSTDLSNQEFSIQTRKLVDVGPYVRIRRRGFAELQFFENPTDGDTLTCTDGTTTKVLTFRTSPSTTGDVKLEATLDETLDTLTGTYAFRTVFFTTVNVDLDPASYPIYAEKGSTATRTVRVYLVGGTDIDVTPNLVLTSSDDTAYTANFQQFQGSTGAKSGDDNLSAWNGTGYAFSINNPDPEDVVFRMSTDADGTLYMPRTGPSAGGASKSRHIQKWVSQPQGNTQSALINSQLTGKNWAYDIEGDASSDFATTAVAVRPELEFVYPDSSISGPEYVWVANNNLDSNEDAITGLFTQHKLALIARTPSNQNVRNVIKFAVAGTQGFKLSGTTWSGIGTVARSSESAFTQAVAAYGQMFFVDNGLYTTYDPVKDGGTFEAWEAKTAGEIPDGCRLAAFYRGRMVVARSDKEPHTIFASAVGDPYDWDFFPKVSRPTKAFGGANQDTARNPDVVNALAPFYDDVLLVGGDHSITQYRGDLNELGQVDYFTDVTGMAFGNSWALSPEGLMYFFGSRGGVWVMSPRSDGRTQPPIELTRDTIAEELRSIDLSQYLPKLVWDQECQGLHVFITPLTGSVSATTQHWFWEARTKSWWPQEFNATTLQPYSAVLLEGIKPVDRKVAIGCDDGYIRVFDKTSANDDGTTIASDVLIGPIFAPDTPAEQRISSLHAIVANIGAGCRYTLYASDNPESLGTAVASGDLAAGYNDRVPARARGGYIWIKLENATGGGQWALESLHADLHLAGRRRDR